MGWDEWVFMGVEKIITNILLINLSFISSFFIIFIFLFYLINQINYIGLTLLLLLFLYFILFTFFFVFKLMIISYPCLWKCDEFLGKNFFWNLIQTQIWRKFTNNHHTFSESVTYTNNVLTFIRSWEGHLYLKIKIKLHIKYLV